MNKNALTEVLFDYITNDCHKLYIEYGYYLIKLLSYFFRFRVTIIIIYLNLNNRNLSKILRFCLFHLIYL